MLSPWSKQSHGCSCQSWKATNHTGTFRNLPNPTSWTYASIHRNPPQSSGTFRDLPPEPTPFYTGTLRNLPEPASGTYAILQRNSPEPSGTRLRNLHQHTPELSGTFRNLPEPSSRTCSCDPHRHTPELIWAEDPISLRCWGITSMCMLRFWKISFGGIPNSSSIDVLMPYAIFDYMGAFLRSSFAHVDNIIPVPVVKTITWLLLSRFQGKKPHRNSSEPSEPCLSNLHQHAPELFGTLRNLPNPAPEPTPTRTGTLQNPPEPSETFRNQPFGTFRNLPPEPTPA